MKNQSENIPEENGYPHPTLKGVLTSAFGGAAVVGGAAYYYFNHIDDNAKSINWSSPLGWKVGIALTAASAAFSCVKIYLDHKDDEAIEWQQEHFSKKKNPPPPFI